MTAYYNEFDPYAAQWLRNLISAGHIAPGEVDERSIVDVQPDELAGYRQCHFFAGIGGWSLAARLAGWDDTSELWTGSCPCQPFSVAGKQAGQADERHLWPEQFRLISARRPAVWMGEQVAAAVGKHWLDGVHTDLESIGYASGAVVVPACAVDAPHRRDRAWIVADAQREGEGRGRLHRSTESRVATGSGSPAQLVGASADGALADADQSGQSQGWEQRGGQLGWACGDTEPCHVGNAGNAGSAGLAVGSRPADERGTVRQKGQAAPQAGNRDAWRAASWLAGADGKARRFEPSIRLLAHGVPARVGKLRAYGNAIVPQVAAEIIGAYMDCQP